MQTRFTPAQLQQSDVAEADAILRRCVHCGFCNATCPTYRLTGDELDGPRGRIYLIKGLLENDSGGAEVVRHLDRCLSCLACMTTCPSGVDYMHLADIARPRLARHGARGPVARIKRALLVRLLPRAARWRVLFSAARKLLSWLPLPRSRAGVTALLRAAPADTGGALQNHYAATGPRRGTVALLAGCVQQAMGQDINHATVRVLNRAGFDVDVLRDGCCGAVAHHLGDVVRALEQVRANVRRWSPRSTQWQAILVNASGCGTMLKDYAHLLRHTRNDADPDFPAMATRMTPLFRDACEFLAAHPAPAGGKPRPCQRLRVVSHTPCSLRHGQRVVEAPRQLLREAGFDVIAAPDDDTCCGSAGTYNVLQPGLADRLGQDKAARLEAAGAEVVATGNLGCQLQIGRCSALPTVHTLQLLDWAGGGPMPPAIVHLQHLLQPTG